MKIMPKNNQTIEKKCEIREQHCWNKGTGHTCALCCFCKESKNHPEIDFTPIQEVSVCCGAEKWYHASGKMPAQCSKCFKLFKAKEVSVEFKDLERAVLPIPCTKCGFGFCCKEHNNMCEKGRADLLAELKEKVEKLQKIEAKIPIPQIRGDSYRMGYNSALDTVLKLIDERK